MPSTTTSLVAASALLLLSLYSPSTSLTSSSSSSSSSYLLFPLSSPLPVSAFRSLRTHSTNPVPAGYSKPLIDTSGGAPDREAKLATLASILNKEPTAAAGAANADENDPNNPLYDNDIDQPQDQESKNERAKAAYQKEAQQLRNLIKQGSAIVKILPDKQKRLKELEAKLKTLKGLNEKVNVNDALEKQQTLLKTVQEKSSELSSKLSQLKSTQAKLEASIAKVQSSTSPKFREVRNEDDGDDGGDDGGEGEANQREDDGNDDDDDVSEEKSEGSNDEGSDDTVLMQMKGKDLQDALKDE